MLEKAPPVKNAVGWHKQCCHLAERTLSATLRKMCRHFSNPPTTTVPHTATSNGLIGLLHKCVEIKKMARVRRGCEDGRGRRNGVGGKWINHSLMEWQDQWAKEWVSVAATKAKAHSHILVRSVLSPLFNYNNLPSSTVTQRWLEGLMLWLKLFTMKLNSNHQHLLQWSAHLCAASTTSRPLLKVPVSFVSLLSSPPPPSSSFLAISLSNTLLTCLPGSLTRCSVMVTPCSWRLLPRRMLEHTPARPLFPGLELQKETSLWQ